MSVRPRQKLWIERDGLLVMSDYRVRLLRAIAAHGSLSGAASEMGLSYRRAWGKIREIEENLGYPLVRSAVGGAGGGQTSLTPAGLAIVEAYEHFQERAAAALDELFDAIARQPLEHPAP